MAENLRRAERYVTTGEAARLCSVTPDTVLKWVKAGKVPAQRTAGGHHRIPLSALTALTKADIPSLERRYVDAPYHFCWEFHAREGEIPESCEKCIVFRSRSRRCYEMSKLPAEAGFVGLYCKGSCEQCDYFKTVIGQRQNVIVVTDRASLREALEDEEGRADFNLKIADCEYRCSMLVERFRPDYIVIDCSLGPLRCAEFAQLLHDDARIPFVRIVLAGDRNDFPKECDRMIYALIGRNFRSETLSDLIKESQPEVRDAL
jgi:excisionase family DNA binding protein